jgi:hypothetical protein
MLDPDIARLLATVFAAPPPDTPDVRALREAAEAAPRLLGGPPEPVAECRDLAIEGGARGRIGLRIYRAASAPAPALLYFGGNAEEISWSLADDRWPRGWTVAGVNYRGYGTSEGRPGERELLDDGLRVFDALAARSDVDARRIVVVGRSLGTGVAVHVAAARPVAGAILISPFDSLAAVGRMHYPWLPVDWLLRHRFDSAALAASVAVPMLTIIGAADGIIPPARSRALFDAWAGAGTWVAIPGADHNDLGSTPAFWEPITTFVEGLPARP